MTIAEKLTAIAENEQRVYEAGKNAEWSDFWDNVQEHGNRRNYNYCFAYTPFNETTFKPKYDLIVTNAQLMFANHGRFYSYSGGITDLGAYLDGIGIALDMSECTTFEQMFYLNQKMVNVPTLDARKATTMSAAFFSAGYIKKIEKIILPAEGNTSLSMTSAFDWCSSLTSIRFEGLIAGNLSMQHCPLDKASIMSVVNALSPTTSGKTLTLSKSAKEKAFTADEWSALIGTKSNWTISLV